MLLLEAFPFFIMAISIALAIVTKKVVWIYFSAGAIICEILNKIEKKGIQLISNDKIFERPNPPKHGCGWFHKDSPGNTYGFPSGHAQFCGFFSVFWTLYLLKEKSKYYVTLILAVWMIALTVTVDRVYIGCHNVLQVSVGFAFGIVYGWFCYWLYKHH